MLLINHATTPAMTRTIAKATNAKGDDREPKREAHEHSGDEHADGIEQVIIPARARRDQCRDGEQNQPTGYHRTEDQRSP